MMKKITNNKFGQSPLQLTSAKGRRSITGQAMTELAIFGSVLLFVMGIFIRYGLVLNYQQNLDQQAFRQAMQLGENGRVSVKIRGARGEVDWWDKPVNNYTYEDDEGNTVTSAMDRALARQDINYTVQKDKPIPDPSNPLAIPQRVPMASNAQIRYGNAQYKTMVPGTTEREREELPRTYININDKNIFAFTTGDFYALTPPFNKTFRQKVYEGDPGYNWQTDEAEHANYFRSRTGWHWIDIWPQDLFDQDELYQAIYGDENGLAVVRDGDCLAISGDANRSIDLTGDEKLDTIVSVWLRFDRQEVIDMSNVSVSDENYIWPPRYDRETEIYCGYKTRDREFYWYIFKVVKLVILDTEKGQLSNDGSNEYKQKISVGQPAIGEPPATIHTEIGRNAQGEDIVVSETTMGWNSGQGISRKMLLNNNLSDASKSEIPSIIANSEIETNCFDTEGVSIGSDIVHVNNTFYFPASNTRWESNREVR